MPASVIVIVLARAGSKGLPGKNVAPVAGRPCVEWTLDAARASRRARVRAVSTDDGRVAALARRREGFLVVDRPEELAADVARVDDAARHALAVIDRAIGGAPDASDAIVMLYANVPARPPGLIDGAVELLERAGADSVQSFTPVGKHHPWWTVRVGPEGRLLPWEGDTLFHGEYRRQALPPAYVPDGGVLVVTRRALCGGVEGVPSGPHAFLGADRRAIVTPEGSVVDIDGPLDLAVADAVLRGVGSVPGSAASAAG